MQIKKIMTRFLLIFIITLGIYFIVTWKGTDRPVIGSVNDWSGYMEAKIPGLMDSQDVPGLIIALIQKGNTVWIESYGYADLEKKIPMTIETRCRVESISKSVTAWGVMKLVEEGKIELNRTLASYLKTWSLPESPYFQDEITINQLLNQSSGMPLGTIGVRYDPEVELPPLKDYLKKEAIPFQKPGRSFSYSNTGYNLLELLIEEVTEREFSEYMSNEIFTPLKMESSSFIWSPEWKPEVPTGYDAKGRPIPVYVYPDKASGGLFSTAEDIASFVKAGMKNYDSYADRVLSDKSIEKIYLSSVDLRGYYSFVFQEYGFGHFIETLSDGTLAVSNGGQGSGWMTQFYSVPSTGDGIVLFANSQRSWPLFSAILLDWSRWNELPPVGMSIIIGISWFLRIFLVFFYFLILLVMVQTVISLLKGKRQFLFVNWIFRGKQILQITLSILLISTVLIISQRKYFFLNSVFPVETPWIGGLISALSVLLFFLALVPRKESEI